MVVRLALATGATSTAIATAPLVVVGYDPAKVTERAPVTTASGIEYAPWLTVERFLALGWERREFRVLAHTLPVGTGVDGLLDLDFFRGRRLTIDFREGVIDLD